MRQPYKHRAADGRKSREDCVGQRDRLKRQVADGGIGASVPRK